MNILMNENMRITLKVLKLIALIYLFVASIKLMGYGLTHLGIDISKVMNETTDNPFTALFIGVLVTSIIQSSSTTTVIVVTMVGAGFLDIIHAIPIVMGANIGTSITNIIVSMAHIRNVVEFRRAFSASIIHDFFNLLSVIVILPIQIWTNFLGISAEYLGITFEKAGGIKLFNPVKTAVAPVLNSIEYITNGHGIAMFIIALIILFFALTSIVKTLKSLVVHRIEVFFDKYIFRTALRGLLFGIFFTAIVQSSSITTSLIVPLAGAGILTLEQIFPYTLGANVGTTITAILGALATGDVNAVSIAFAHTLFNIFGIIIFWPIRMVPIYLARKFTIISAQYKIVPFLYILLIFFVIPIILIYAF